MRQFLFSETVCKLRTPSHVYLWQKKVITYNKCTNTHYKMTIFYMFICRFYLFIHISFHLEAYMCYKYKTYIYK